jgi:hypothetical protein
MRGLVADVLIKEGKVADVKVWESRLNRDYQVESILEK